MSYILDALRKSDLQRQRGAAPTLLAVQDSVVAHKRPAYLAYGLLAAVLVGAGMVIGWLRPWQPEQVLPGRPEPVAVRPVETTPRQTAPAPSEMAAQPKPETNMQNATQPAKGTSAQSEMGTQTKPELNLQDAPRPARSELAPRPKRQLAARAKPQTEGAAHEAQAAASGRTAAPDQPVDTVAADDSGEQTVMTMAELPNSVRQELPALRISVHAYSDNPAARLVGIDNRILREGDSVVPGLTLEQITPDGMIFSYREYRFRRGVK